jgi:hypothetical protein
MNLEYSAHQFMNSLEHYLLVHILGELFDTRLDMNIKYLNKRHFN